MSNTELGSEIKHIQIQPSRLVAKREVVAIDQLQKHMGEKMPAVYGSLMQNGVKPGAPSSYYYSWDEKENTTDLAAGVEVDPNTEVPAGMEHIDNPAGDALMFDHWGSYDKLYDSHTKINDYMKENNLLQNGPVMERYLTDPGTEPDQNKWNTQIIYPIVKG